MEPAYASDEVTQATPAREHTAPAQRPKRKRIAQPVFRTRLFRPGARTVLTAFLLAGVLAARAQDIPAPATNPTGQAPVDVPAPGWAPFDDVMARELRIPPDELRQLRAVDERFMVEYRALGTDPARDPRYPDLIERRNHEVRRLMSGPMFTTWSTKYRPVPNTIQEQREGGISTPPPPTP